MSSTTVTPEVVWINQNGMAVCASHGGSYLTAAIQSRPNARTHNTPLDNWERFTAEQVAEFGLCCETCGR